MNEKTTKPEESAGTGRRKRVAPTIDLTATEVPPATRVPPVTSEADPPPPNPSVEEAPVHALPISEIAPPNEPPFDDPPPGGDVSPEQPGRRGSESSAANAPDSATSESTGGEAPKRPGFMLSASVLAAGFIGAAAMSVILAGLWLAGLLPMHATELTATRARLTALEMQVQELQKRSAVAAGGTQVEDTKTVEALVQRIDAADNAIKSLGVSLSALNQRSDEVAGKATQAQQRADAADKTVTDLRASLQDVSKTAGAPPADLEPLQQRIAALEQQASAAKSEIARVADLASASDRSARRALSAAVLRDAVLRGAPFDDELAQAKSLGADATLLAPLQPFASTGVPSDEVLAQELSAILPGMEKAAAPAPTGGFLQRLQANASRLVRVRPVDAPAGDDPTTVLARLDVDAAHADINAALADLDKLTDAQRGPAQAWIEKARNRQAALAAVRQFAADAARSFGSR
jgi:hypothetical protein